MVTRIALTFLTLAFAGCSGSAPDAESRSQADRTAIEALFEDYLAAFHAEDTTRLRSYYTDDAVLLPPGPRVFEGTQAIIQEWYQPMFDTFEAELSLTTQEIRADATWGFARGTYLFRLRSASAAAPIEERGKYIDLLRRDSDGRWKIARAIHNADNP